MAKVHLYMSAVPFKAGQNVIAKCGDVVDKAQLVFAWDDMPVNTDLVLPSLSQQCGECWRQAKKRHKGKVLLYAISDRVTGKAEQERR